ncbi:hypothetical protein WR25_09894 isoform C [Diploscapter pachys]|uniref:Rhodanese domain-containing protein n=1 Tax=Diploscapter pachys TaxID=2018661 RepID=A0A2A2JBU4_9BILA|nr:hypothetical protein WR25_09894 isoform C [Diploscapter pachys]
MVKKRTAAPKAEKKPKAKQNRPKGKQTVNVNEREEGEEGQQDEQMERLIADQPIHVLTEIIGNKITSQPSQMDMLNEKALLGIKNPGSESMLENFKKMVKDMEKADKEKDKKKNKLVLQRPPPVPSFHLDVQLLNLRMEAKVLKEVLALLRNREVELVQDREILKKLTMQRDLMSLNKIVEVATVANLVKKGLVNREGIRILHCSFAVTPKPDWKQFEKEKYGKFEQLIQEPSPSRNLYLAGHIPQAIHADLDVAMYPSQYQRYTYYPSHIFEQYVQLLGINKDDHLIFCGRDRLSGMLFSSKMAWLFKSYGHEKLSLLNGGLTAWEAEGHKLETEPVEIEQRGNWTAKDYLDRYNIRFEELDQMDGDKKVIEQTDKINFLDTRHPDQFEGKQETGLDQYRVNGTHIPGFKNTPVAEIFAKDGKLRSKEELRECKIFKISSEVYFYRNTKFEFNTDLLI